MDANLRVADGVLRIGFALRARVNPNPYPERARAQSPDKGPFAQTCEAESELESVVREYTQTTHAFG